MAKNQPEQKASFASQRALFCHLISLCLPSVLSGVRFHLNSLSSEDIRHLKQSAQRALTEGAWFNKKGFRHIRNEVLDLFIQKRELMLFLTDLEHFLSSLPLLALTENVSEAQFESMIELMMTFLVLSLEQETDIAHVFETLQGLEVVKSGHKSIEHFLDELVLKIKRTPSGIVETLFKSQSKTVKWALANLIHELVGGQVINDLLFLSLRSGVERLINYKRGFVVAPQATQDVIETNGVLTDELLTLLSELTVKIGPIFLEKIVGQLKKSSLPQTFCKKLVSILRAKESHPPFGIWLFIKVILPFLSIERLMHECLLGLESDTMKLFLKEMFAGQSNISIEQNVTILLALFLSHLTNTMQRVSLIYLLKNQAFLVSCLKNIKSVVDNLINGDTDLFLSPNGKRMQRLLISQKDEKRVLLRLSNEFFSECLRAINDFYNSDLANILEPKKQLSKIIETVLSSKSVNSKKTIEQIESQLFLFEMALKSPLIAHGLKLRQETLAKGYCDYLNKEERLLRKTLQETILQIHSLQAFLENTSAEERKRLFRKNLLLFRRLRLELAKQNKRLRQLATTWQNPRLLFQEWWSVFLYLLPLSLIEFFFKSTLVERRSQAKEDLRLAKKAKERLDKTLLPIKNDPSLVLSHGFFKPEKRAPSKGAHKSFYQKSLSSWQAMAFSF